MCRSSREAVAVGKRLKVTNELREMLNNIGLGRFTAEVTFLLFRFEAQEKRLKNAPETPVNRGKRFAAKTVADETQKLYKDAKKREYDLELDEVYSTANRYEYLARYYLSARAGKPFVLKDFEGGQKADREIVPKPTTVQELRGRGVVYRSAAEDLREVADRWKYPTWRHETRRRAYDKFGRMVQPNVGKRPRTVQKILKNRPPDMGPFEGGFLDT